MPYTGIVDLPFSPGDPTGPQGPLARFLPALERGAARSALERYGAPGDLLLDPFGASPRLVLEAAQAGRAVLVASNNPITRFVMRHVLQPFSLEELQAALAQLSAAPKDGGRLEPFLLDLYRTQCSRCAEVVSADYFVWDRETNTPILRSYACKHCNHTIEEPTTDQDRDLAAEHAHRGLHHALALEQVAPQGDPDRAHAEAALAVYPGRAVYAIVALLNKLGRLSAADHRDPALALTLSALDEVNALWGHPEGRTRPLQLVASPQYRESNLWRALERAVADWAFAEAPVAIEPWPESGVPVPGTVALYAGPARELAETLQSIDIHRLLTVFPRPNQAYWTLSALWAAWLWDRDAAVPIKAALRRRRYDWSWHAGALHLALRALTPHLKPGAEVLCFMPDAEPGFIAAALTGMDSAGFNLTGRAVRVAEGQAVLTWKLAGESPPASRLEDAQLQASMMRALQARGEPAAYRLMHAAAYCDLAERRALSALRKRLGEQPISLLAERIGGVLGDRRVFVHHSRGVEPESGQYWLQDESGAADPLADRVEALVLEILQRRQGGVSAVELERQVCDALPGLSTPDRRIVMACLRSYAWRDSDNGLWHLRDEDQPKARLEDCEDILNLLASLGSRLGFRVTQGNPIGWRDEQIGESFSFTVEPTARMGVALQRSSAAPLAASPQPAGLFERPSETEVRPPAQAGTNQWIVIPGGRASLVAEKSRQDPRLREWMRHSGRMIKFRHVRRLAAETTLDRSNLLDRLTIDPPGQHDPQMPLL